MESEVYADILFLVNFSMDFLCFYLCAKLLKRPLSLWRGVLSSALGGVYAVSVLFMNVGRGIAFFIDLAVGYFLCMIALVGDREKFSARIRLGSIYLLISLTMGGVMTAMFSQLNRVPGLTDKVEEDGLESWLFFALALISAWAMKKFGRIFHHATLRRRVTLVLSREERRVELQALFDTGNLLKDPISGKMVIVADKEKLQGVMPDNLLLAANAASVPDAFSRLPTKDVLKTRLIPAKSALSQEGRMLLGWQPDKMYIKDDRGEHEIEAWISPVSLPHGDGIEAVIPCELIP